jgi:type II secretory pathway pseudopilin PulG
MAAATSLALLVGCGGGSQPPLAAAPSARHVSPAAVEPPVLPAGSFDQAKERAELAAAQAARQAGDGAQARAQAEAAVAHWPSDLAAWDELQADCQALKDESCRQHAAFFRAKVEFVSGLAPRVAVLGFQTIAEEPPGTRVGGFTYDQATIDTARRLWAFYHSIDPLNAQRQEAEGETFTERYPYGPTALAIGIVAGVLTLAKELANK